MAKLDKLITYAYLKEECDLPQNLPDEELEHKVYRAQEMLRMLMGDEFYQDYIEKFKTQPFSTEYQAIFSYIKQFIAWQAYEFYVPKANFKLTRGGFRVHTEENSVVATDIQMATLIKDAKAQSQYYKKLFYDFLNHHASDYPLYNKNCNDNLVGNGFHISAVKNKSKCPQPYGTRGSCKHC